MKPRRRSSKPKVSRDTIVDTILCSTNYSKSKHSDRTCAIIVPESPDDYTTFRDTKSNFGLSVDETPDSCQRIGVEPSSPEKVAASSSFLGGDGPNSHISTLLQSPSEFIKRLEQNEVCTSSKLHSSDATCEHQDQCKVSLRSSARKSRLSLQRRALLDTPCESAKKRQKRGKQQDTDRVCSPEPVTLTTAQTGSKDSKIRSTIRAPNRTRRDVLHSLNSPMTPKLARLLIRAQSPKLKSSCPSLQNELDNLSSSEVNREASNILEKEVCEEPLANTPKHSSTIYNTESMVLTPISDKAESGSSQELKTQVENIIHHLDDEKCRDGNKVPVTNTTSESCETLNRGLALRQQCESVADHVQFPKQNSEKDNIDPTRNCDKMNVDDDDDDYLPPTQPIELETLKGVVAHVEVRTGNDNRSMGVKAEMRSLGATVVDKFTPEVTHVVFKEGLLSTYRKAKKKKIPLVSVLWIEACRRAGRRVSEGMYPPCDIEHYEEPNLFKTLRKAKSIQPNYEGKVKRRRMKKTSKTDQESDDGFKTPDLSPLKRCLEKGPNPKLSTPDKIMKALQSMAGISPADIEAAPTSPTPSEDFQIPLAVRLFRKYASPSITTGDSSFTRSDCTENDLDSTRDSLEPLLTNSVKKDSDKDANKDKCTERVEKPTSTSTSSATHTSTHTSSQNKTVSKNLFGTQRSVTEDGDSQEPSSSQLSQLSRKRIKLFTLSQKEPEVILPPSSLDGVSSAENESPVPRCRTKKTANRMQRKIISGKRRSVERDKAHHRRSSEEFIKEPPKARKSVQLRLQQIRTEFQKAPSLVCTSLHSKEVEVVTAIVEKLGRFQMKLNVDAYTTHVVSGGPRRTLNLLKGIAKGCWIVTQEWVLKSLERGSWLDEEDFELTCFSPAVKQCRVEKLSFGPAFQLDLFANCGPIFLSRKCIPPANDLELLILWCGGTVARYPRAAKIVVGDSFRSGNHFCINEKWILDSVMFNELKPMHLYTLQKE